MAFKLFNDAVKGTKNGTRTTDVKNKLNAFNGVDALAGKTSTEILAMTTENWLQLLATKVGGEYVRGSNATGVTNGFNAMIEIIKNS